MPKKKTNIVVSTGTDRLSQLMDAVNSVLPKDDQVVPFDGAPIDMPRIPTGITGLDYVLGGGFPKGRSVEIYGPESSGKTTLALHAIAAVHKNDKNSIAVVVDTEHAMDRRYMLSLGIDPKRLMLYQPDSGEAALTLAVEVAKRGVDIILLDSIASTKPKEEMEMEFGDNVLGRHAKLIGSFWPKMTPAVSKSGSIFIAINQVREKIGVTWGNPEVTMGGNASKFYASIRLVTSKSIARDNQVTEGSDIVGNRISVRSIKNKTAPPLRDCSFNVLYGLGVDRVTDTIDWAIDFGIVTRGGSWYTLPSGAKLQGMDSVFEHLSVNAKEYEDIEKRVREDLKIYG